MLSWYEYEFIVGGMSISYPKTVYLGMSHTMSLCWSVKGLVVLNALTDCAIRYEDGTVVPLDKKGLLLPWDRLEKGQADVLVRGKSTAKCMVRMETSLEKWEKLRDRIDSSESFDFDLSVKMLQFLRGKSVADLNSEMNWLQDQIDRDKSLACQGGPYMKLWQQRRMDLYYEAMFSESMYDRMSKDRKKLSQTALESVYNDVVRQ